MFNDKADYDLFRQRFTPTKAANRNPEPESVAPVTEEAKGAEDSTPETAEASAAAAPEPAQIPEPEPVPEPPPVKPELGTYLKYTASNFVSALSKAFAGKPSEKESDEQQNSSLPPSFRSSSAKSSSPATLPPPQKP